MPPLSPGSPYLLLAFAGCAFLILGAILASLLPIQLALVLAELICLLIPAMLFRRGFAPPAGGWPALRPAQPWWWALLACAGAAALGLSINALAAISTHLHPSLARQAVQYAAQTRAMLHPDALWLSIAAHLSVIVFAPLTEELLFRGAMLPAQRAFTPQVLLVCLLNGALFSAFHMNLLVLVPLTLLGAYLAWLTISARSVLPAILAHATMNGMSAAMVPLQQDAPALDTVPIAELALPGAMAGVVAATILAVLHKTRRPV
jgi:membrane protease YdiL (CAAX protease family)